ncbi:MAG: hypothetical protein KAR35_03935, partial [Candidatus Heimdallarchaeota archaeon]|nr:hypothetical protein [Candidatus Heimdallarchaeota archaeon]MCK5048505.1 hypothetical protein [Candidatus Heimdallarchaeota archaeon]
MMIFNKWFFRKIFTQKKQTLFQLLPFLLSVIVLIGTLGSYAFLLTKKQSEYLDQPLDISIQVDGANLKIV